MRGLVGAWVMNEGAGDVVRDLSGEGNDGTTTDVIWQGEGPVFNGTSSLVNLGDMGSAEDRLFTWIIGFKTTEGGNDHWFVSEGNTADNNPIVGLINNSGVGRILIRAAGGANKADISGSTTINDGNYHTMVAVADAQNAILYVDGNEENRDTDITGGSIPVNTTTIGALRRAAIGQYAAGTVFFVYIYNRVLTSNEVMFLHSDPYAMFVDPMIYWGQAAAAPGGNAPTGALYGPLAGPMAGPI